MPKTTCAYWNPMSDDHRKLWSPIEGLEGRAEELTLSVDQRTGEYTRLTRFFPGSDTSDVGAKCHAYPEEVFILSGKIYDVAFDQELAAGDYASRPPGQVHGPFRTDVGCLVLEVSFPNKAEPWPGPGI